MKIEQMGQEHVQTGTGNQEEDAAADAARDYRQDPERRDADDGQCLPELTLQRSSQRPPNAGLHQVRPGLERVARRGELEHRGQEHQAETPPHDTGIGAGPAQGGDAFQEQLNHKGVSYNDIYRRHQEFFGLHDVAERMLDFDEAMQAFRFHHLKLAQRIIGGGVIGTMGTPVEVLQQRMQHLAFRELWELRNQITEKQGAVTAENKTSRSP